MAQSHNSQTTVTLKGGNRRSTRIRTHTSHPTTETPPSAKGAPPEVTMQAVDGQSPKHEHTTPETQDGSNCPMNGSSKRPRQDADEAEESKPTILEPSPPSQKRSRPSGLFSFLGSTGWKAELEDCIVDHASLSTTFSDVEVPPATKDALLAVTLWASRPQAFTYGILSRSSTQGVLLYGPPGTGKTLLIKALAKEAKATFLSVSGADIRQKCVGEGEKKIQAMFALARERHPCIILIDEADATFRSRSSDSATRGHREDLNQFLVEMDGINGDDNRRPIVVASTNRPFDIDEAILRRLGRRVMVDVPSTTAREKILRIHTRDETMATDVDLAELATRTPDYTGSDLQTLVMVAALEAEKEVMMREKQQESALLTPSPDAVQSPPPLESFKRVLRREHFVTAKRQVCPAPKSDTVAKIREFHNKYGNVHASIAPSETPVNKTKALVSY